MEISSQNLFFLCFNVLTKSQKQGEVPYHDTKLTGDLSIAYQMKFYNKNKIPNSSSYKPQFCVVGMPKINVKL